MDILNITQKPEIDESIERYEYHSYETITGKDLNNIKFQISGQEIENLFHPGQATTILGLLKFPDDFSKSMGLNELWYKDNGTDASVAGNNINNGFAVRQEYIIRKPDLKGKFSFRVPLKHIFGFCDDYEKVVYG